MINIKIIFSKRFLIHLALGGLLGFLGLAFYWITGYWPYGTDGAQGSIIDLFYALIKPPYLLLLAILFVAIVYAFFRMGSEDKMK